MLGASTKRQIPGQRGQCVHSISNNTQCPCDHASPISVSDYWEGDGVGSDRVTLPPLHHNIYILQCYKETRRREGLRKGEEKIVLDGS